MRRSDAIECFHGLYHRFIQPDTTIHAPRHDRLETNRCQVLFRLNMSSVLELIQTIANGFRIIRNPLETALVQQALPVRKIKQPPLKRRRTQIGYEDLHAELHRYQSYIVTWTLNGLLM